MERAVVDLPLATLGRLGYDPLLRRAELRSIYLLHWKRNSTTQVIRCRPLHPGLTVEELVAHPLVLSGRLLRTEGDTWVFLATLRSTPLLRDLFRPFGDILLDRPMEVRGEKIRLSLLGEEKRLRTFQAAARDAGVEHRLVRVEHAEADPRDPLVALTPHQRRVLRAAVEMGYFEYPKRVRLHDLGALLGVDKSTVSKTLRRAQKQLLEEVMKV